MEKPCLCDNSQYGNLYSRKDFCEMLLMEYPVGAKVRFKTSGSEIADVRSNTETLYWSGHVNGNPICDDHGTILAVPVWCERENREATTVIVVVDNIVSITPA
jgi:hypothetical protein